MNACIASIPWGSLLTARQELDLARRVQAGDTRAKYELVEHNLRLVIYLESGDGTQYHRLHG